MNNNFFDIFDQEHAETVQQVDQRPWRSPPPQMLHEWPFNCSCPWCVHGERRDELLTFSEGRWVEQEPDTADTDATSQGRLSDNMQW